MKKFLALTFAFVLALVSCHKKEPEVSKFPVKVTQGNNSVTLSWSPITFSDFKNVTIFRSATPIPDPGFGKTIDASLQIGLISDKTVSSFVDSNMIMNNTGTSYYKVVVTFGNRFIVSDLITVVRNGFSMVMSTTGGSPGVIRFDELHTLYYVDYNMGTIRAVNYLTRSVTATTSFVNNGAQFYAAINNGNPELFLINNNNTVYCYNANTLALKYTFNLTSNYIYSFCIKNNYLYTYSSNYLYTYNLATKTLVNTKPITESISTYTTKLFPGPGNSLYFRYYVNNYNSSTGQYTYANKVKIYSLSGAGVPSDSATIDPMVLNTDTLNPNGNNYPYINLSQNGKYLSVNPYGDVYTLQDHSLHNVMTSFSFIMVSFSVDGQYLVTRPNNTPATGYSVGVFSLPSFSFARTLRSGNLGSSFTEDDFTLHDTLISYNVTSMNQGGQFQMILNVAFNKID
jgi:hypothetical protein